MNSNTNPPLSVLVSSLVLAAITLLVLLNLQTIGINGPDAFNLERFNTLSGQRPVVVALGTSKTRSGLYFDSEMTELLKQTGSQTDYIRITRGGGGFGNIEPALKFLSDNPPDLLLLEAELLVFSPHHAAWRQRLNRNVDVINGLTGIGRMPRENYGEASPFNAASCQDKKTPELLAKYRERAQKRRITSTSEREQFLAYLDLMISNGTRIVILEIPRSPAANTVFPKALKAEAEHLQQLLVSQPGYQRWTAPADSLPEGSYCDQGHLSTTGQATLSRWIAERIASQEPYDKVHHSG